MRKTYMKKNRIIIVLIFISLGSIILFKITKTMSSTLKEKNQIELIKHETFKTPSIKRKEKQQLQEYERCINEEYIMEDLQKELAIITEKVKEEKISVSFLELKNKWSFQITPTKKYYGASLIKLLDATYLIRKAIKKELDLNTTLTYEPRFDVEHSYGLKYHKYYEKISIKTLIRYVLSLSDNGAHHMLFEWIGSENLKKYARSLGITLTINDSDHFGELSAEDAMKILQETYEIVNLDTEYNKVILENMKNSYFNYLNFDSVSVYHKYGEYKNFYHDIGMYLEGEPYLIVILSEESSKKNTKQLFQNIHKELHDIYQKNLKEKEIYCIKKTTIK